jgi:hypothetical protein
MIFVGRLDCLSERARERTCNSTKVASQANADRLRHYDGEGYSHKSRVEPSVKVLAHTRAPANSRGDPETAIRRTVRVDGNAVTKDQRGTRAYLAVADRAGSDMVKIARHAEFFRCRMIITVDRQL